MAHTAIVIGVGAAAGVGAAVARRFAREGLHVFVGARNAERIDALAAELRGRGLAASAVAMDATQPADVARLFDEAAKVAEHPELVVYNAGNAFMKPLLETRDAEFESVWRLGCFGGFLSGREAARRMLPSGRGTIVFTGATASLRARPPFTAFAAAKAGLRAVAHGEQLNRRIPQLKERLGPDGMLAPDAIAETYWQLHLQPRSAWTLELDLRPYKETF
jgi:NAD(P)-dependent dehydrogenase (short-subunit alcohol dehydrogenase family)